MKKEREKRFLQDFEDEEHPLQRRNIHERSLAFPLNPKRKNPIS
jgi:hypothetical protein